MMHKNILISIVSHFNADLVALLLGDLQKLNLDKDRCRIVVTSNVEEDISVLEKFTDINLKLILNDRPFGFAENHNKVFRSFESNIFCVLNPDVRIVSMDLPYISTKLDDSSIGVLAPVVFSPNKDIEDSARRYPTPFQMFRRLVMRKRLDYAFPIEPVSVDWVAGMCMFFNSDIYKKIGGFNERFHLYLEDVELCLRLGRSGKKIIYDPSIEVIHDARRSSRRRPSYMRYHVLSYFIFLQCLYFGVDGEQPRAGK